jgi:predicted pyridoxine 5'-phosphate oxidase superfamily flavin-nucleotide-binding protein
MSEADVYHTGEIAVQRRTGERAVAERRGAMIAHRLTDGARAFLSDQGVVSVGAAAHDGSLWASVWCGSAGFLRSDSDGERVELVSALDRTLASDHVRPIITAGAPLAMLVIDFATRRRLRINGTVTRTDPAGVELRVAETFGNCNKYIQRRHRSDVTAGAVAPVTRGHALDADRLDAIARTDTAFVASIHPVRGLDVSHRGGQPGFIWVEPDGTLRMPDYPGNSMFQTLGNFEIDTRAGLALVDFDRRRVVSLTGHARAVFDAEDAGHPTGGTGRYWSFTIAEWVEVPLPTTMEWTLIDRSSFSPPASQRSAKSSPNP